MVSNRKYKKLQDECAERVANALQVGRASVMAEWRNEIKHIEELKKELNQKLAEAERDKEAARIATENARAIAARSDVSVAYQDGFDAGYAQGGREIEVLRRELEAENPKMELKGYRRGYNAALEALYLKEYRCLDCCVSFYAHGDAMVCPLCGGDGIEEVDK